MVNHGPVIAAMKNGQPRFQITQKIVWRTKPASHEFQLPIKNEFGEPLILGGVVKFARPQAGSIWVRNEKDRKSQVVRLCIRGAHTNKRASDKRKWKGQSHLHHWSQNDLMEYATDPIQPPWPPVDWIENSFEPLAVIEFQRALSVFCQMHGIAFDLDMHWDEVPSMPAETFVLSPAGEEIP
ncbi:hypothetical protein [Glutamicibacter protophormiae]|uniref:hypothetical protein n=1 Tax=Glutamicibacter protophormiae TaxID=37930 RepID=UPI003A8F2DBA